MCNVHILWEYAKISFSRRARSHSLHVSYTVLLLLLLPPLPSSAAVCIRLLALCCWRAHFFHYIWCCFCSGNFFVVNASDFFCTHCCCRCCCCCCCCIKKPLFVLFITDQNAVHVVVWLTLSVQCGRLCTVFFPSRSSCSFLLLFWSTWYISCTAEYYTLPDLSMAMANGLGHYMSCVRLLFAQFHSFGVFVSRIMLDLKTSMHLPKVRTNSGAK